jgi:hypothetical protein
MGNSHLSTADNALKVQSTGSGLDDLEEEFMDGRIQYAFARVEDPHVSRRLWDDLWLAGRAIAGWAEMRIP